MTRECSNTIFPSDIFKEPLDKLISMTKKQTPSSEFCAAKEKLFEEILLYTRKLAKKTMYKGSKARAFESSSSLAADVIEKMLSNAKITKLYNAVLEEGTQEARDEFLKTLNSFIPNNSRWLIYDWAKKAEVRSKHLKGESASNSTQNNIDHNGQQYMIKEAYTIAEKWLETLSDTDKLIFELRNSFGMKYKEICEKVSLSESGVRQRYDHIESRLRKFLNDNGFTEFDLL